MTKVDPVLDEIRRVRHEMSAEIGHDPRRMLAYYQDLEEQYRQRGDRNLTPTEEHSPPVQAAEVHAPPKPT